VINCLLSIQYHKNPWYHKQKKKKKFERGRKQTKIDISQKKTDKGPTDMKRCSISLITRKMQIKSIIRYFLTLVRKIIIK
jgi:hypothetical protein